MIRKNKNTLRNILCILYLLLAGVFLPSQSLRAAAGVPKIINVQGRLLNSSGDLLGGPSGTNYCYKFSLYDAPTGGTKVWPSSAPSTMTILTREGVFNGAIGDVSAGGDTLDYDFQTNNTIYVDIQVAARVGGSCTTGGDEVFESLTPRSQVVSSGYAINSGTVGGFTPAQSATDNQIPVLSSGALTLGHATAAGVKATGSNALTFQSGVTGDIQFFSSSNKITSGGALTLAGLFTANGGLSLGTQTLTGTTGNIDYTNFDVNGSNGNTDIGGTITAGSGNEILTLASGKIDADALTLFAGADGVGITSSASGLERQSDGLTLLQGCANGQILKWVESTDTWDCAADAGGGGGLTDGDYGDIVVGGTGTTMSIDADVIDWADIADATALDAATSISFGTSTYALTFINNGSGNEVHNLSSTGDLVIQDNGTTFATFDDTGTITFAPGALTAGSDFVLNQAAGTNFQITATAAPTVDMIALTNTGQGTVSSGADGLSINFVTGDGANLVNSAIDVTLTNGGTAVGDIIRGLTLNNITPTAATEVGLYFGTGYDTDIQFADATGTMSLADNGTLILSDGTSTTNDIFQVGTATSRGNALIYGDLVIKGGNIARNLTGVIDVFVYDTSTDVDGGDWRNSALALQMSWATETKDDGVGDTCVLATDDRCGSSAFPRKAIIASTASGLYIFDAADNSLWMKFTQAGTYALGADTSNDPSGVTAQNGVVFVGTNGASATGLYAIDFKQDVIYRYNTTNRTQSDIKIGTRNSTATYSTNAETGFAIINNVVNDVSVNLQTASAENLGGTLLAPIDSQAGPSRGVSIIAAATDSGVSVINMGTRKVINYSDVTNDDYNQVYITRRGRMYATNETQGQLEEWKAVDTVSVTQANGTPTRKYDELLAGGTPITLFGAVPTISTSPGALAVIERGSSAKEAAAAGQIDSGDIVFVGTNQGLAEVHTSGGTLANASWSKITTKDSGTPYMVGAARAVYLFDEAAGAIAATSSIGASGTTQNPMDTAGATSPTFGGAGIRGGAANFNNNSYLCSDANNDGTCDADTDFNAGTVGFTVSLWFKHSTTAASDTLFERCYTPATPTAAVGCIWAGMTSSGAIKFGIDSITTWTYETTYDDSVTSTALYNDNQWHHAVFVNTDTDICLYIDGRQAAACDTSLAATATMDASQVLTIGGACSGANCTTGTNFWDGSIDEFVWSSNGGTTADGLTAAGVNKLFLDGRTHMIRPSAAVTDATTFTSTTIGDSGEAYVPDSFVGLPVELTGGTGAGQTRTIVSNTATTFTVYPAFTTTPDSTTDYRVAPSKLYGASNNVTAVAVDAPTQLNKVRKIYVGTNDGADGGGVSVFTNAGAGGLKTEVYSSDSGVSSDDFGTAWSGTDADDIRAISSYSDTVAFASEAFIRAERKDASFKQLQADTLSALDDIRMNMVASGLFGGTQDVLGLGQGADLAEYYYSNEKLEAGDVVAIQPDQPAGIDKSTTRYQKNLLGVVSTKPGLTLGPIAENAYPIALAGRIPVKITDENGAIHAGDMLTSSSRKGYAMKATGAGAVLGRVLNEPYTMTSCDAELPTIEESIGDGPGVEAIDLIAPDSTSTPSRNTLPSNSVANPNAPKCGYAMLFVGLSDSLGENIDKLSDKFAKEHPSTVDVGGLDVSVVAQEGANVHVTQKNIMTFLESVKNAYNSDQELQSLFTDKVAAAVEIVSPSVYTKGLSVNTIDAFDKNIIEILGDVEFFGRPYFTKDTAGFAVIKAGSKEVSVVFAKEYIEQPIVNTTMTFEGEFDSDVFKDDIRFVVSNKNVKGFTIVLNKKTTQDIRFSWTALAVRNPTVSFSLLTDDTASPAPTESEPVSATSVEQTAQTPSPSPETTDIVDVVPETTVDSDGVDGVVETNTSSPENTETSGDSSTTETNAVTEPEPESSAPTPAPEQVPEVAPVPTPTVEAVE